MDVDPPVTALAIDTCLNGCSVGAVNSNSQFFMRRESMTKGQDAALLPLIRDIMAEAGLDFQDLDLIVSTRGPGSFTGLRIGMSAAKALSFAQNIPICGLTTFEVMAAQFLTKNALGRKDCLAVILESKRRDYYFQLFDRDGKPYGDARAVEGAGILEKLDRIKCSRVHCTGNAIGRFVTENGPVSEHIIPGEEISMLDPQVMLGLGLKHQEKQVSCSYKDLSPVYLRGADVSKPKLAPRKIGAE